MCKHDRSRHQLRGLVAGVTEHQTLIPSALLRSPLALGLLGVHALGDIGTLRGDVIVHEDVVRMEDVVLVHVANLADRLPDDRVVIELRLRCDLAADNDNIALHKGFARHATKLVLREAGVQDRVRYRITHLVRVAFTHGL